MAELTPTGLVIDRYPEILQSIEENERELVDPNIYTRDDEFLGRLNKVISERMAAVQELAEYVYDSFNIQKAEGKSLDDLAALRDVRRLIATRSNGRQIFQGTAGTTIPAGTLLESLSLNRISTTIPLQLLPSMCLFARLEVANVQNTTAYSVFVNNMSFSYTSSSSATSAEIVSGLVDSINNAGIDFCVASVEGNTIKIESTDSIPISIVTGTTFLRVVEVGAAVVAEVANTGPVAIPAMSVLRLVTPVAGVTGTYNPIAYNIGRNQETDEELRVRIPLISSTGSTGTVPSIEGALLANVLGVIFTRVIENTGSVPDASGRPDHSYEPVVIGGTDEDVAKEVWRTKPAGIPSVGNTTEVITDSNGNPRLVTFTRPEPVFVAYRVTYTLYDEELYPLGGDNIIRQTVSNQGSNLGLGVDVIPSRAIGPIHTAVGGIDELTVEVQVIANPGDTPDENEWQLERIEVPETRYASTGTADVVVVRVV